MLLNTVTISAIRFDNEPIVRSLSAIVIANPPAAGDEIIKWNFDDAIVWSTNALNNSKYQNNTTGQFCLLSSMIFQLSTDTYDYTSETKPEYTTNILVAWLTGDNITGESDEEIAASDTYVLGYDGFPDIKPPVLYINYENTDYSPLFYRAQSAGTTYNARISAVFNPSLLNLTNLLTKSEKFTNDVWSTNNNITVIPSTKIAPTNLLSATELIPVSGLPFNTIKSITNLLSANLPTSFLAVPATYVIPMSGYTTTGSGVSAVFTIGVASNTISNINVTNGGKFFEPSDTITINQQALGLAPEESTISFDVDEVFNISHDISRPVGPLQPQTYTYSVFAYPSGGKYLYFNGFDQGYALFDVEQNVSYNLGKWKSTQVETVDPEQYSIQTSVFKPQFNGTIRTVAYLNDRIFFGGDFTTCNGISAGHICAVDLSGNGPLTTGLAPSGFDGRVNTIVVHKDNFGNDILYVGGKFTRYRGQPIDTILSSDLPNGGRSSYITCLTGNGGNLAGSEAFRGGVSSYIQNSTTLYTPATSNINPGPEVHVIKIDTERNLLFIGGDFTHYSNYNIKNNPAANTNKGYFRNGLVVTHLDGKEAPLSAFDTRAGTTWNTNAGAGVWTDINLTSTTNRGIIRTIAFESNTPQKTILLGGQFAKWRNLANTQFIARVTQTGTVVNTLGLNPGFLNTNTAALPQTYNTDIKSIVTDSNNTKIFIGGDFSYLKSTFSTNQVDKVYKVNPFICLDQTGKLIKNFRIKSRTGTRGVINNLLFKTFEDGKFRLYVSGSNLEGYGYDTILDPVIFPCKNFFRLDPEKMLSYGLNDDFDTDFDTYIVKENGVSYGIESVDLNLQPSVLAVATSGTTIESENVFLGGSNITQYREYSNSTLPVKNALRLLFDGAPPFSFSILEGAQNWRRCTATFTLTSTKTDKLTLGITTETDTPSSASNGKDSLYVWGAQLNYGSTGPTTPYLSTGNTPATHIYTQNLLYFNNQITPTIKIPLSTSTVYTTACVFGVENISPFLLSSVQILVSANSTYDSYQRQQWTHTFTNSISVIFVSNFLSADFAAFPKTYFLSSGDVVTDVLPNSNFTLTPGPCFYGEGHTETINLSASGPDSAQYFWKVTDGVVTYGVSAATGPGGGPRLYKTDIPTQLDVYPKIPISLLISDGVILSSGPVYYFNDENAGLSSYPFYYNTQELSARNTKYKKDIEVVSYNPPASSFNSGFLQPCPDFLPTNDTTKSFFATLKFATSGETGNILNPCFGLYELNWQWATFKHLSAEITTPPFGTISQYTNISATLTNKPSSWKTTKGSYDPVTTPPFGITPGTSGPYPKIWGTQAYTGALPRDPNVSWGSPLTWLLSTKNWTTETQICATSSSVFIYELQNNLGGINPYTVSIYENTPVRIKGTQTIYTVISAPPYDWDTKQFVYEGTDICEFQSRGDFIIYTSNRYVLTGTQIKLQNLSQGFNNVNNIVIDLDEGQTITLQGSTLYNDLTVSYNYPGYKTITSTVNYNNPNKYPSVTSTFTDIVKIIEYYDTIDLENYRTQKTPLTLPWPTVPKIASNEWVNEDNINAVIKKFYSNLEYLNTRGRSYNDGPDEFYGWLGTLPEVINVCPVYTWEDLDCLNGGTSIKWEDVQKIDPNFPTITTTGILASCCSWEQHICKPQVQNPDRLGKYCIDWKWKTRKSNVSTLPITWNSTKANRAYNKKWRFEPCTTRDGSVLIGTACDEGMWQVNINKLDTYYDPITNCTSVPRCVYRDIVSKNNLLYVALTNEIKVLSSDYSATFVTSKMLIDETFAFKDIRGLALDSTGKLFVLDGTLNRVASYIINLTDPMPFELFLSWGGYGTSKSTSKFSRPNDICIDTLDNIWIADTGNKCLKQYSNTGTWIQTIIDDTLRNNPPISMTVDSENNIHTLLKDKIRIYKPNGEFYFEYTFTNIVTDNTQPLKINSNYNKEIIYIVFNNKVLRYFKTGIFAGYLIDEKECATNLQDAYQDEFRNTLVISNDKILKYVDIMNIQNIVSSLPKTYWTLNDLLIHKDEYVQNWVYNKTFQRLWDNIEILRNSLMYKTGTCKEYKPFKYDKDQILVGQNEIVTSAVINRNIEYLWENLQTLLDYFDPNCI